MRLDRPLTPDDEGYETQEHGLRATYGARWDTFGSRGEVRTSSLTRTASALHAAPWSRLSRTMGVIPIVSDIFDATVEFALTKGLMGSTKVNKSVQKLTLLFHLNSIREGATAHFLVR